VLERGETLSWAGFSVRSPGQRRESSVTDAIVGRGFALAIPLATDRSPGLATGEKRRLPGLVGRANEHLVDGHPAVAGHDVNDGVSDVLGEQRLDRSDLGLSRLSDVVAHV
jgi:hypothetical protein